MGAAGAGAGAAAGGPGRQDITVQLGVFFPGADGSFTQCLSADGRQAGQPDWSAAWRGQLALAVRSQQLCSGVLGSARHGSARLGSIGTGSDYVSARLGPQR